MMRKDAKFNFISRNTRSKTTAPIMTELLNKIYIPLDVWELTDCHIPLQFDVFSLMVKSGFELGAPRWHSTVLSTEPLEPPTPLTKRYFSSLAPFMLFILKTLRFWLKFLAHIQIRTHVCVFCVLSHKNWNTYTQKQQLKYQNRRKKILPTARGVPRRSPIQVLTTPDVAWLQWSDENWYFILLLP